MPPLDDAALAARYGRNAVPDALPPELEAGPVVRSLLAHRSTRAYLDRPLDPGMLETIVAAASSAPTSSNVQTWSVVAVQDPERRARLAELSGRQAFIARAPVFLCWIADLSRLQRLGERHQQRLEGLDYLEMFMVALVDAALAAQNALVAAESMGLGTVYVGGLRNRPAEVAAELNLPPNSLAAFGLCLGWPDPAVETAVKPRLPQSLVLHHERYGTADEADRLAGYDQALAEFSEGQGMGAADWSGRMLKRVAGAGSLSGRHVMAETLKGMGFGLK